MAATSGLTSLNELLDATGSEAVAHDQCIRRSLAKLTSRRVSIFTLDRADEWRGYLAEPFGNDPELSERWGASETHIFDPDDGSRADAVVCANLLDDVPSEDLPWLLAELFGAAESLVHLGIRPARDSLLLRARPGDPIRRATDRR